MVKEIDGIAVYYEEFGTQNPDTLLILQGWGTDASLYRRLAEHLGQRLHVLLPELPGFGHTPEPSEPYDAQAYADFTLRFLHALGIRKTHLLGHSNGGRIILKLASVPGDVSWDKLVFLDSAGVVPEKTPAQLKRMRRAKLAKRLLKPFPKLLDRWRSRHGSADYRAASPLMRQTLVRLVNEDLTVCMPRISRPSLLIWGTEDRDTPLSAAAVFEQNIPDSGLVRVEGAGHYAHLDRPDFVYRVLDSFFGAN